MKRTTPETPDTVPDKVKEGLTRAARHHGAKTRAELFSAPGLGPDRDGFEPRKAERN